MGKRMNPFHHAAKEARKSKRAYAERNKKEEDSSSYHLTDYYFERNLRKVHPYYYTFKSFTKRRWIGSRLIDVFKNEFRGENEDTLTKRFEAGHILLNGEPANKNIVLKNNDFLEGKVHRHELPVKADALETIFENENFLVINKPASVPVHPCGRFRYNTISLILAKEGGRSTGLNVLHRLDRLTSGVQIFTKSVQVAKDASVALELRQARKIYVAGVQGNFSYMSEVVCEAPISILCHRIGVHSVSKKGGQACLTIFKKVVYDVEKDMSILICAPVTGRTHQIRVHCQFLGNPIVFDPLYNSTAWGDSKGKGVHDLKDDKKEEVIDKLVNEHNQTNGMQWRLKQKFLKSNSEPSEPEDSAGSPEIQCVLKESEIDSAVDTSEVESSDVSKANSDFSVWKGKNQKSCSKYFDPICEECGLDFEDPTPSQLEIYLHAFTYKLMGYTFVAPLPHWALPYKEVIEECIPNLEAAVELKHEGKTISGSVKVPSV